MLIGYKELSTAYKMFKYNADASIWETGGELTAESPGCISADDLIIFYNCFPLCNGLKVCQCCWLSVWVFSRKAMPDIIPHLNCSDLAVWEQSHPSGCEILLWALRSSCLFTQQVVSTTEVTHLHVVLSSWCLPSAGLKKHDRKCLRYLFVLQKRYAILTTQG